MPETPSAPRTPFTDEEPEVEQPHDESPVSISPQFTRATGGRFRCMVPKPHEGEHRCKVTLEFPNGKELTGDLSWPDIDHLA